MNGFYIVNKEKNMTSHSVCHKIERSLKLNKCGHSGTLDPNAEGVLVVAFNKATKLMPLLNEHDKEYITTIVFGILTDTLDLDGKIISESEYKDITDSDIDKALSILKKEEFQTPPMYSAIKINGKKLYDYARKNIEIEIPKRSVSLYDAVRMGSVEKIDGLLQVEIKLKTSKGFYVRSFARDLGENLNTYGTMKSLLRVRTGVFDINNSRKLNEILENPNDYLRIEDVFRDFEKIYVNDYMKKLVLNGVVLDERQITTEKPFLVYHDDILIAVYEPIGDGRYKSMVILDESKND